MAEYQKVRGSHEISIRAAGLLEDMRPHSAVQRPRSTRRRPRRDGPGRRGL